MSKRTLSILFLGVILLAVYLAYELKPTSSTGATALEEIESKSMEEILSSIEEPDRNILLHAYAYNPNCPNCDKGAIIAELVKVNDFKDTFSEEIHVITLNVFAYSGQEMELLQDKISLAQTPSTYLLNRQGEIVFEQIGRISEEELEKEIRKVLTND